MDGVIVINKPAGYTSHDIVNIARKTLHTKKVGHAGTLDPDATGVLVLCVNRATKILQFLGNDQKEYIATLSLGISTDTYDASGKVVDQKEVSNIHVDQVKEVLTSFLGRQMQTPPIYSAIKVNGKKLYQYARNNQSVEIEKREIEIFSIDLLEIDRNDITFKVKCSKGTYVRSLCVDIAAKLGYPGHMKHLVRTQSGMFSLDDANSLEELKDGNVKVNHMEDALDHYPSIIVEDETIIYHGKRIKSELQGMYAIKNTEGKILAMYQSDGNGYLKSVRGLW